MERVDMDWMEGGKGSCKTVMGGVEYWVDV